VQVRAPPGAKPKRAAAAEPAQLRQLPGPALGFGELRAMMGQACALAGGARGGGSSKGGASGSSSAGSGSSKNGAGAGAGAGVKGVGGDKGGDGKGSGSGGGGASSSAMVTGLACSGMGGGNLDGGAASGGGGALHNLHALRGGAKRLPLLRADRLLAANAVRWVACR
jgi:hypothetical protein